MRNRIKKSTRKSGTVFVLLFLFAALLLAGGWYVTQYESAPSAQQVLASDYFEFTEPKEVSARFIRLGFNTLYAAEGQSYTLDASAFFADDTASGDHFSFFTSDPNVAVVDENGVITAVANGSCTVTARVADEPLYCAAVEVQVGEHEYYGGYTIIKGILVVNKQYALPPDYQPGLLEQTEQAFSEMKAAAAADGITLWYYSAYRSYSYQQALLNGYANRDGMEKALTYCAPPGMSEHQSGMALDINSMSYDFGNTPAGEWLAENAWKYGFILRYADGKQAITQYNYEPWHFRWLGKENAKLVFESGLSLEEYLGIDFGY